MATTKMKRLVSTVLLLCAGTALAVAPSISGNISTVAGNGSGGYEGDGADATLAKIKIPADVAVDADGNIYIADNENYRIRKVDAVTGFISTVGGIGSGGYEGDDGPATLAKIKKVWGIAVDSDGNLYLADTEVHRIRRIDAATGIITTVAGSGSGKYYGDGGSAVGARLKKPHGVVFDAAGDAYIAGTENHVIRKVDMATGIISTFAGIGSSGSAGDGGAATAAELHKPHGVAFDSLGNLFIADTDNNKIRRVDAGTGVITTYAGTGSAGDTGDGGAATLAKIDKPEAIAFDSSNNLYIADTGSNKIRKVDAATGDISTIAGLGGAGYSGDGGDPTLAKMDTPTGIDLREAGYFGYKSAFGTTATSRNVQTATQITLADPATVSSISAYVGGRAGDDVRLAIYTDNAGEPDALVVESAVDQMTAAWAWLTISVTATPLAAGTYWLALETSHSQGKYAYDTAGGQTRTVANNASTNGYLTTWGASASSSVNRVSIYANFSSPVVSIFAAEAGSSVIRKIIEGNTISTAAGIGSGGYSGDGGAATAAKLNKPEGVGLDSAGDMYIADTENHVVRKVDANTGIITTYAGTGSGGYSGDAEPANLSEVNKPRGLSISPAGDVIIADTENHAVRRVTVADELIESIAGSGVGGYSGDGGAAVGASIKKPRGVAVDSAGNFYIADTENSVIRKVTAATGIITTVAGTPTVKDYTGDGGSATAATLDKPCGVAVASNGDIYIADTENHVIRKVTAATGIITTFAGKGQSGYFGDGGPATNARFDKPAGVAIDSVGNVFIADTLNHAIRLVEPDGTIYTLAGTGSGGYSGDGGAADLAKIKEPWGVALSSERDLYIADTENHRIRMVDLPKLGFKIISWQETEP